jgi:siroheme synthase
VGKRCGVKRITQDDINRLMVESAQRGLQVLRLKSGDPTIFGRLNEEIDALVEAGVEFEVVPGITAGAAAAAALGVSMTDRRASSRLVIVSGHHARNDGTGLPQDDYDWSAIAHSDETVAIYMPGGELGALSAKISAASEISAATPCAIVSRAGTTKQRVYWTTLAGLREAPVLPAPTILLLGRSLAGAAARAAASPAIARRDDSAALVAALGTEFFDEIFGVDERRAGL